MADARLLTGNPFSTVFDPSTGGYLLKVVSSASPETTGAQIGQNSEVVICATGTSNSVYSSSIQTNYDAVGAYLLWDVLAQPVTGSAVMYFDIFNPADSQYTSIYQSAAYNATGSVTGVKKFLFYPGAVDTGSQLAGVCQLPLPLHWRVRVIITPATAWNFSVSALYVGA